MDKTSFLRRLTRAFTRPRQIIILDSQSGKPARNIKIRFFTVFLIFLVIIAATFFAGFQLRPRAGMITTAPQDSGLHKRYDQLRNDLAESNAMNDLQERQLEGIKQELLTKQEQNGKLITRLHMLENILKARKSTGVQLLNTQLQWADKKSIQYNLTLVKGGNYPRRISGFLTLVAHSPEGEAIELSLGKESPGLPFRMESHTFLRGLITWEYDWHPDKLLAIVVNQKGKELLKIELPIEGEAQ